MANRGWATRIPVWVRASGVIALVLVAVVLSAMLVGAAGGGGGMDHDGGQTGDHTPPGGRDH